jgi:hypothetical protein
MTDKELLEKAAKAAGIEYDKNVKYDFGLWLVIHEEPTEFTRRGWNPLTDDGDALRLAVKLGLDVCIDTPYENDPHTHVIGFSDDNTSTTVDAIENHGDPYAATRRAIVRAAAEIGRSM